MSNIGEAAGIYIGARQHKVRAAAHVDNLLGKIGNLLFIQGRFVFNMTGASYRTVREQRNYACMSERHGFLQELLAVAHGGVLPIPVSPDHCREWAFALGDYQVGRHSATLGTGVGNVVDRDVVALLDTGFLEAQGRFLVVVEVAENIGVLSKTWSAQEDCEQDD